MPYWIDVDQSAGLLTVKAIGYNDVEARAAAIKEIDAHIQTHRLRYLLCDFRDQSENTSEAEYDRSITQMHDRAQTPEWKAAMASLERVAVVPSVKFPDTARIAPFWQSLGFESKDFITIDEARRWLFRG